MLADRKMTQLELAERIGLTPMNLSRIKNGRIRAIRLATLDAICRELRCGPGDILQYLTLEEMEKEGLLVLLDT